LQLGFTSGRVTASSTMAYDFVLGSVSFYEDTAATQFLTCGWISTARCTTGTFSSHWYKQNCCGKMELSVVAT